MKETKTIRGFGYIEFEDMYSQKCSLQKSSLATEDAVWLGIDDADPKVMAKHAAAHGIETKETAGWVPYPIPPGVLLHTRMHLNQEMALQLIAHLLRFVETGEL